MAIKTNELQQLTSALGTDSVLLDTGSAGTARLSLDRLKAFTLGQTSVPARTVEKAAADLPDYIAGLPRLLAEALTIKVSGTLTADELRLAHFYGPGSLGIMAEADGDAVLKARVRVSACAVPVTFRNIRFQDPAPGAEASRNGLSADYGSVVMSYDCSFSSTSGGVSHNHGYRAIAVGGGAVLITSGIKNISGCACAALATRGGIVILSAANADAIHDNAIGAYVWEGGIISLSGSTPDTLGGAANVKESGIIIKSNGTLL